MTTMYVNKRNGQVAAFVSEDPKFKTIMMEYSDGKTISITSSTFKRWWKKLDSPEVVEPIIDLDNPMTEEEAQELGRLTGDEALELAVVDPGENEASHLVPMPGTEDPEWGKKAASNGKGKGNKPAKKDKSEQKMLPFVEEGLDKIFSWVKAYKDEIFVPANGMKMRTIKAGGHMYCKIDFANKSFRIAFKSEALPKDIRTPDRTLNHMFDYVYIFDKEITSEDEKFLREALAAARAYRIERNKAADTKTKKAGKKEDK